MATTGVITVGLVVLAACSSRGQDGERGHDLRIDDGDLAAVARNYADLAHASYGDAAAAAEDMRGSIGAFLVDPTEATMEGARQAWRDARDVYGPTEAFRFYRGPIDHPDSGPEGRINGWPIDEAYIDYVEDAQSVGIVNDVTGFPEITTATLIAANERGGETNVSTGWHAIEFLLWGQDLSDTGPGQRPVSDYTTSPTAERRITYLRLLADLLVDDLASVRDAWAPGSDYRRTFLDDVDGAVSKMLRGIGALSAGELADERIAVAYETQDQEDEHSCFSDNTTADIVANARGILTVYTADHPEVHGTSLSEVVAETDPDLDEELRTQIQESIDRAEALDRPFDRLILGNDDEAGRVALRELHNGLQTQGETLARLAERLGEPITLGV